MLNDKIIKICKVKFIFNRDSTFIISSYFTKHILMDRMVDKYF
jgi:hypothetical protein